MVPTWSSKEFVLMAPPPEPTPPRPPYPAAAALLSYLLPGLGQIAQGRWGKGILFLVSLHALFFYGLYLGSWSNVYLPDVVEPGTQPPVPRPLYNVYHRLQFAGQFWIGIAAWPALAQYVHYDPRAEGHPFLGRFQRAPFESRSAPGIEPRNRLLAPHEWPGKTLNELQIEGDKTWDLAWVITVIAGVLNVLVIYDAYAGPAMAGTEHEETPKEAAA
jgi:hypothetical protein